MIIIFFRKISKKEIELTRILVFKRHDYNIDFKKVAAIAILNSDSSPILAYLLLLLNSEYNNLYSTSNEFVSMSKRYRIKQFSKTTRHKLKVNTYSYRISIALSE